MIYRMTRISILVGIVLYLRLFAEEVGVLNRIGERVLDVSVEAVSKIKNGRVQFYELLSNKPTVLVPVYYRCPSLCGPLIKEVLLYSQKSKFKAGQDYNLIFFSFDPEEDSELAAQKRDSFLVELDRDLDDVLFLVSSKDEIERFFSHLGFLYIKQGDEFAHPPAVYVLRKDGTVTHIFKTMLLDTGQLDLALVEASEGKLGGFVDKVKLVCYGFDVEKGRYNLLAFRVLQIGGTLTLLFLGGIYYLLLRKR